MKDTNVFREILVFYHRISLLNSADLTQIYSLFEVCDHLVVDKWIQQVGHSLNAMLDRLLVSLHVGCAAILVAGSTCGS